MATAEAAPLVGEDIRTLFHKLGDAFSETHARIEARFDRLEARFDRMDERFDRMDQRFDRFEARMDAQFEQLIGLIRRDELKL
jgi:hypothetical protein